MDLGLRQVMQLVHRAPRRYVVGQCGDTENRCTDVEQCHRPVANPVMAFTERVVEEKLAQVLAVHALGHARNVGVPGHQIVHWPALPEQVLIEQARPEQIVGTQHLKRSAHLVTAQVPGLRHLRFQHGQLAFVDVQAQFPRFTEIGLCRKQAHACQAVIPIAGHGRAGNGQQCAPQTIAGGVHLALRNNRIDCLQRGKKPLLQVVVHPQVALGGAGVFP